MIRAHAAGCSCCCAACVTSVVARRVRVVAAQLALDSLAVVFLASPGAVILFVFGVFERVCVAKAERAYVWFGLHRCRVVACRTGGRCPDLVGCPSVVGGCSALVSAVVVLPQDLRYTVGLAGAFRQFFPERCLGGSGGGSPRTGLRCLCSFARCSVLSDSLCCLVVWVVHSGEGSSQDRPLLLLVEVLPKSALCSFWATIVLPYGLKCVVWLGCVLVRFSQDGSRRSWWRFSPRLLRVVLVVVALSL
ncbi:hypothetical protein Taro_048249 [Colocasia esculenta]|uniref:Uncharacterized protein n=1 Tax=Colocasia esculenta TaxID=4460 RepID=A0A843X7B2_COLES|nr:hypothetical protein [Colocasia esculenta]